MSDYYDENADQFISTTENLDMSEIYDFFLPYLEDGAHILDAGCGTGRDSSAFLKKGFKVDAFDASDAMVENAAHRTGLNVQKARFEDFSSPYKFDGIWCCASLLHVDRQEIEETFVGLTDHLKKGGVLYASFKYGTEEVEKGGRYFNNMTEETFLKMISEHPSLQLIDTKITGDQRADRQADRWLNVLVRKVEEDAPKARISPRRKPPALKP